MSRPHFSIIIVTFNSESTILDCLNHLVRASVNEAIEIIVIDNASSDSTVSLVMRHAASHPHSTLIENVDNLGFSRAANQGISVASGDFVVLLNPDVIPSTGWLSRLAAHFRDDVGAVGPLSDQVAGLQRFPLYYQGQIAGETTVDQISDSLFRQNGGKSVETRLLIGFCLMVPRRIFETEGTLDETLFLGNDDLELSWRLRTRGYRLLVATDIFVHHQSQASFKSLSPERSKRLVQESTDALQRKLENYYGVRKVPPPLELWGIEWFTPTPRSATTLADTAPSSAIVSIVVPVHNQLNYTRLCVESIRKNTNIPYELIFVDNDSADRTAEYLRTIPDARIITNRENAGFAKACNQGIKVAGGEYVVLLNNDTIVTEHWAQRMVNAAAAFPQLGILGPCSNNVTGDQKVAEARYDTPAGIEEFAREHYQKQAGQVEQVNKVIGFCMFIRRSVIERIGGLDERFGNGNFEDEDLCVRANIAGYRCAIVREVFIHHFGQRTFEDTGVDYHQAMRTNWEIFRKKWQLSSEIEVFKTGYPIGKLIRRRFNPRQHCCPLPERVEVIETLPKKTTPAQSPPAVQLTDDWLNNSTSGFESTSKESSTSLYLDLMKRCLANWIYGPDEGPAFDPQKRMEGRDWPRIAHSMMGLKRLDNLHFCVEDVLTTGVPGDLIETGVWRGGGTIFMRAILKAYGVKDRCVWVADSFEGLPASKS